MQVFVTGATGLVGRALCAALVGRGHGVVALSRARDAAARLPGGVRVEAGDPGVPGPWQEALARCDACVHLAGEPVAGRWTAERKRRIRESRVASTANVAAVVGSSGPAVLVSGSAVGFYGARGDELLDEGAAPGAGFLADVCREWEAAAAPAARRARVVLLRTGIVLAAEGGALPRMVLPFRLLAGGPLGGGDAWQPWIHLADEVGLVLLALEDGRAAGPLNACAPEPARNRDLARAIGRVLRRPSALPTPALALRLALGEMAEVVLASQRVVPRRALALGHRFLFPDLEAALRDLLAGGARSP
jgi:uncharacterized protein (TIGR01777 family)